MAAMRNLTGVCLLMALCSGCSQTLLTKEDYQGSQAEYAQNHVPEALTKFPHGREDGDFVTTMERTYLSLVQGVPDIEALKKQDAALENRVRYHVSREVRTFFYVQTAGDYYAAEHEVIWMHFLLSWGYSQQGKYEDACVEARKAATLLTLPWSPAGHFDDANMRVFLGMLWTMCGEWREAQVDFRAAYELDNSLAWANELAQRDQPPAQFFLILGGPGPEPEWAFGAENSPLRAARHVNFRLRGQKSRLSLVDQQGYGIEPHLTPDASPWYARQAERDNALHDLILDSTFGAQATVSTAWASTKIAATTTEGVLVGTGGTALGVAVCYYGTQAGMQTGRPDGALGLCLMGLGIAGYSIEWGSEIVSNGYTNSIQEFKRETDPSYAYRFVRFLPEYQWLGWSEKPLAYPLLLTTGTGMVLVPQPGRGKGIPVSVIYVPDADPSPYAPASAASSDNTRTAAAAN